MGAGWQFPAQPPPPQAALATATHRMKAPQAHTCKYQQERGGVQQHAPIHATAPQHACRASIYDKRITPHACRGLQQASGRRRTTACWPTHSRPMQMVHSHSAIFICSTAWAGGGHGGGVRGTKRGVGGHQPNQRRRRYDAACTVMGRFAQYSEATCPRIYGLMASWRVQAFRAAVSLKGKAPTSPSPFLHCRLVDGPSSPSSTRIVRFLSVSSHVWSEGARGCSTSGILVNRATGPTLVVVRGADGRQQRIRFAPAQVHRRT